MKELLAIGLGGFAGALARHGLASTANRLAPTFPLGTLAVNVLGCFAIGVLAWFVDERQALPPTARLLLRVGFLGSFTTFSTFALDALALWADGQRTMAIVYVLASNIGGLLGAILGWWVVQRGVA